MLISLEKGTGPYYGGSQDEKKRFLMESAADLLAVHQWSLHQSIPLFVSVSGRLLKLFASDEFKKEFLMVLSASPLLQSSWEDKGWEDPLHALLKLVKEKKIHLAASCLSFFPLALVNTEAGIRFQIESSRNLFKEVLGVHPGYFHLPYGSYVPGLERMIEEAGFFGLFLHRDAFHVKVAACRIGGLTIIPYQPLTGRQEDSVPGLSLPISQVNADRLQSLSESDSCKSKVPIQPGSEGIYCEYQRVESLGTAFHGYLDGEDLFPDSAVASLMDAFTLERQAFPSKSKNGTIQEWSSFIDGLIDHLPSRDVNAVQDEPGKSVNEMALHILILSWEFPPRIVGGLARHVYGLAKALAGQGHKVTVITAGEGQPEEKEQMEGITVYRVNPLPVSGHSFLNWTAGLNLSICEMIQKVSGNDRVDILHAHDWLTAAAASAAKDLLQIPLAATIHSTEYGRNQGIFSELQKRIHRQEDLLLKKADKVIVCSSPMRQELKKGYGYTGQAVVIPNGITEAEVQPASGKGNSYEHRKEETPIIFTWGRMVFEKGFQTLISSAKILSQKSIHPFFIVSGSGPYLKDLKEMVKKEGLGEQFLFNGHIDDVQRNKLLERADLTVIPSLYEPFGIVALEAMAAGKPVIVSGTGGLKGIVQDKASGLTFTPGDADELARHIEFLLNHREAAQKMAKFGRESALVRYSWNEISRRTMQIYEQIRKSRQK
ncbi:glycosyltransferase family 4 protein [Peribacillus kribbensis]|uniref:glycosyltransferase family 4 protein n=1 Tax=Peribacillus kribbensis TaxID=356658 RepID=UPI0004243D39|nr:glycosyltransferase family 4 protein [Peribacillus kribbensis]